MKHKTVILGSGPAGLTAAIYLSRAKIETLVIDGGLPGGQLMLTSAVENWPGEKSIQGIDLMMKIREQAELCGASFLQDSITKVDFSQKPYRLFTQSGETIETESVIIATGSVNRRLGCIGEKEYFGRGLAVCATCDAPFYKGKDVVVVGGGNTAVMEAEHLLHFAKHVTLVHIGDKLSATDPLKDKILQNPNLKVIYNSTVFEVKGDGQRLTHAVIQNQKDKTLAEFSVDGVFVAIGFVPNTEIFKNQIELDSYGYIVLNGPTGTSKEGVFAAGDVADYSYKQAIVAAGSGCKASLDCQKYINGLNKI